METGTLVSRNGIVVDMLNQYLTEPTDVNLYQVIDSILIRLNQGAYFYADDTGKQIFTGKKELPGGMENGFHSEQLSKLLETAFRKGDESGCLTVNPGVHDFLLSEDLITMIMAGRFTDAEKSHLFLRRGVPEETGCEGVAGWDPKLFEGAEDSAELKTRCRRGLMNLLEAAKKRGIHSMALISVPDVGTGFPPEIAAKTIFDTANEWLGKNRDYGISIEFCCYEPEYMYFSNLLFDSGEDDEDPEMEDFIESDISGSSVSGITGQLPSEALAKAYEKEMSLAEGDQGRQPDGMSGAENVNTSGLPGSVAGAGSVNTSGLPGSAAGAGSVNTSGLPGRVGGADMMNTSELPDMSSGPSSIAAWRQGMEENSGRSGNSISYGRKTAEYQQFTNDASCTIRLFGKAYASVDEYVEEIRREVFSGKKPNEFLWTRIRTQVLYRGMFEKFRQNPELLTMLLGTGIALLVREMEPEGKHRYFITRKQAEEEAQMLMRVRRELRIWKNTGNDISFRRYSLNSGRRVWDMKLHEIAGIPGMKELIIPFASLMVYYQPGRIRNAEEFIERAPTIRALDAAMARRKGGPLPEWRELLQRLSDEEKFGMI